jgi:hypothetical protein
MTDYLARKTKGMCCSSFTLVIYSSHISDTNIQHPDICYENKEKAGTAVVLPICIKEVHSLNLSYTSNADIILFPFCSCRQVQIQSYDSISHPFQLTVLSDRPLDIQG